MHAQTSSPAVFSIENNSNTKAYGHPIQVDVLLDYMILTPYLSNHYRTGTVQIQYEKKQVRTSVLPFGKSDILCQKSLPAGQQFLPFKRPSSAKQD